MNFGQFGVKEILGIVGCVRVVLIKGPLVSRTGPRDKQLLWSLTSGSVCCRSPWEEIASEVRVPRIGTETE